MLTLILHCDSLQATKVENIIPLTNENPRWKLDQSGRGYDIMPNITITTHPWAVLLNDNVYVKDTDSRSGEQIWQYSIKENTWSQHPQPDLFGFKEYTLAVFHSQLTCLGGFVRPKDIKEYTGNKRVFSWNGREWKDNDVEQIPEEVELPSSNELSASKDDTHLYLAWQKDDKVQILQYSRQKKWEKREGPDCKSSGSHIEISVIKKTIFLTEHNDGVRTTIRKASVSSLSSSSAPSRNIWTDITWSTESGLSFFSNLTVSGGNIMLLVSVLRSSSEAAMLFNLEIASSGHAYWNKVGCLQIVSDSDSWKPDSHPSIFGLRNKTLLIVVSTGSSLSASPKVCVYKR